MTAQTDSAVRRSISVQAGVERAFQAFTAGIDHWWPREHHVGNAPLRKNVIEGRVGGRCFGEHEDGSESDWGRVLVWEPPRRFVLAWMINPNWKFEPDLSRTSEVEVVFSSQTDGTTRVDLEHRNFESMGEAWNNMRMAVDAQGGWGTLLQLYAGFVEKEDVK
jgi:Activator of Hsp90 ATPase homolog 1-like protein